MWIMDQVPLGNKAPRPGMARLIHCPACRGFVETPMPLNSVHVFLDCMAVEGTRIREGIRDFLTKCWDAGRSRKTSLFFYVNGMDHNGEKIVTRDHLQRGKSLETFTDMWLASWGQE